MQNWSHLDPARSNYVLTGLMLVMDIDLCLQRNYTYEIYSDIYFWVS